jgi:transcription-repair coupling factor (superfamily II helicase)
MLAATELGAGFQIAMKDLEIRGAGNILGANQSGHIYAVGFDMYTRLLSDAVESLRAQRAEGNGATEHTPDDNGDTPPALPDVSPTLVDIGIPANVPPEYVSDLPTRLDVYRRLVSCGTADEVNTMGDEMVDRFGPLPWQVQNLLYVTKLKLAATRAGLHTIKTDGDKIVLRLHNKVGGARQALQRHLGDDVEVGNTQVRVDVSAIPNDWERPLLDIVEKLRGFTEQMVAQLAEVG